MPKKKLITVLVHTIILLAVLFSMFIWVGSFPYVEAGVYEYGIKYEVNKEVLPTLQILSTIGFAVNVGLAIVSKFTSKSIFIFHCVLTEFCLLHTLVLFFA